jgi:hypothetical protein
MEHLLATICVNTTSKSSSKYSCNCNWWCNHSKDFAKAKQAGASALAAGSMFVFQRPHKAVLISYPTRKELKQIVHGS